MESLLNRRHYMLWTSFHHNAPYYLDDKYHWYDKLFNNDEYGNE